MVLSKQVCHYGTISVMPYYNNTRSHPDDISYTQEDTNQIHVYGLRPLSTVTDTQLYFHTVCNISVVWYYVVFSGLTESDQLSDLDVIYMLKFH